MIGPIAVMCFGVGGVRFAIAVADVVWLGEPNLWAPSLATSLGLRERSGGRELTVTLAAAGGPVHVRVEGPVAVRELAVDQIVPAPRGLALATAVIGFARIDGQLVQLLDVDAVVAGLPGPRDREDPRVDTH